MTDDWVLWGSHQDYAGGTAIKLTGGTLRRCKAQQGVRERDGGWLLAIYAKGTEPTGLRLQAAARQEASTPSRSSRPPAA